MFGSFFFWLLSLSPPPPPPLSLSLSLSLSLLFTQSHHPILCAPPPLSEGLPISFRPLKSNYVSALWHPLIGLPYFTPTPHPSPTPTPTHPPGHARTEHRRPCLTCLVNSLTTCSTCRAESLFSRYFYFHQSTSPANPITICTRCRLNQSNCSPFSLSAVALPIT